MTVLGDLDVYYTGVIDASGQKAPGGTVLATVYGAIEVAGLVDTTGAGGANSFSAGDVTLSSCGPIDLAGAYELWAEILAFGGGGVSGGDGGGGPVGEIEINYRWEGLICTFTPNNGVVYGVDDFGNFTDLPTALVSTVYSCVDAEGLAGPSGGATVFLWGRGENKPQDFRGAVEVVDHDDSLDIDAAALETGNVIVEPPPGP